MGTDLGVATRPNVRTERKVVGPWGIGFDPPPVLLIPKIDDLRMSKSLYDWGRLRLL